MITINALNIQHSTFTGTGRQSPRSYPQLIVFASARSRGLNMTAQEFIIACKAPQEDFFEQ